MTVVGVTVDRLALGAEENSAPYPVPAGAAAVLRCHQARLGLAAERPFPRMGSPRRLLCGEQCAGAPSVRRSTRRTRTPTRVRRAHGSWRGGVREAVACYRQPAPNMASVVGARHGLSIKKSRWPFFNRHEYPRLVHALLQLCCFRHDVSYWPERSFCRSSINPRFPRCHDGRAGQSLADICKTSSQSGRGSELDTSCLRDQTQRQLQCIRQIQGNPRSNPDLQRIQRPSGVGSTQEQGRRRNCFSALRRREERQPVARRRENSCRRNAGKSGERHWRNLGERFCHDEITPIGPVMTRPVGQVAPLRRVVSPVINSSLLHGGFVRK